MSFSILTEIYYSNRNDLCLYCVADQPCTEATDVEWIAILSKFHDFVCKQELKGGISEGRCAISLSSEDGKYLENLPFPFSHD